MGPTHGESGSGGKGKAKPWRPRVFTRWFLRLRKTLTKAGLDTGCKPIGFLSAPPLGLFIFSSSTLVERGWPRGLPLTFGPASLPGVLPLPSSASLASSGLLLSCYRYYPARV